MGSKMSDRLRVVVRLDISGFELNYKSTDEVSVRATLEGAAPTVTSTSNQTIFRITEIDAQWQHYYKFAIFLRLRLSSIPAK